MTDRTIRKRFSGERFGKLTLIERSHGSFWLMQCDCGRTEIRRAPDVRQKVREGAVPQCKNCCRAVRADNGRGNRVHGLSKHPLYHIHFAMLRRCNNPECKDYYLYGERGIKVCRQWLDFLEFYKWAMASGYARGLTIERRNNDGEYSPSNCYWATWDEQNANKRPWGAAR